MKSLDIVLVEDDPSAAMIAKYALEKAWQARGYSVQICHCQDGLRAIAYLEGLEPDALPQLIISDVKMPRMDGHGLLSQIKQDERFKHIPVIMLSTSANPDDIHVAFSRQCAGYLLKTSDFDQFKADLETFQRYWEASRLP